MTPSTHLTVGEVSTIFGAPAWRIRRVVDRLDANLPRIGQYRVTPRDMLPRIGTDLAPRTNVAKPVTAA